ncbi:MAG: polyphosphate kinase 1, partial [Balneolaceae bacterium]
MKNTSLSPDELDYDPIEEQKKKWGKKVANKKLNKVLKEKGLHEDLSSSSLKIFGPNYFFNYELSWLQFNRRVLAEAMNPKNRLLERVKFIGIVCSNLDEFFQKRVGGLKRQLHAGVKKLSVDGLTASDQLKAIREDVTNMIEEYRGCFFNELIPAMEAKGISIKNYEE